MGLSEFREAFYKATGNLLPGGLNSQALEFCQHNPRDKLQEFFNIMASQGGRTFKYFREIVKGKPKAVVERKSKSQERQDGAIAAAQETIRVLQERRYGSEVRGKAGGSIDGVDCYPGHTSIDNGAAIVVPPCLG
jgi:hypothetical protein